MSRRCDWKAEGGGIPAGARGPDSDAAQDQEADPRAAEGVELTPSGSMCAYGSDQKIRQGGSGSEGNVVNGWCW